MVNKKKPFLLLCCILLAIPMKNGYSKCIDRELPQAVSEFFINDSLYQTALSVQVEYIDYLLNRSTSQMSPQDTASLKRFQKRTQFLHENQSVINNTGEKEFTKTLAPYLIKSIGVTLFDPESIRIRRQNSYHQMNGICHLFRLKKSEECNGLYPSEVHNFYTWYVRTFRRECGAPVDWQPSTNLTNNQSHRLKQLYDYLAPLDSCYYPAFKTHLETDGTILLSEYPFFEMLSFDYLKHSWQLHSVNHAVIDFLARRGDLFNKHSELQYVLSQIVEMLAYRQTE